MSLTPEQVKALRRNGILREICSLLLVCCDHISELPQPVQKAIDDILKLITDDNKACADENLSSSS
jgi:hypothetical protein